MKRRTILLVNVNKIILVCVSKNVQHFDSPQVKAFFKKCVKLGSQYSYLFVFT